MKTTSSLLRRVAFGAVLLGAAPGCAPKIEPEIASAAGEPMYATAYPAELAGEMERMNAAESKVKEISAKLPTYPDALKSPAWAKVLVVVDKADEEGRAHAYVEARREADDAYRFFDAEKDEIVKKVAGAAQFAAKQKGCDADVSGAASHALKDTVDKRLQKRLREQSEAHVYIEQNQTALGKDNLDTLADQADDIALASYLAYVAIVERKVTIRRMIEEGERVKQTLDAGVRAEQAYQGESGRTPAEKKASEERAEAMRKAAAGVDAAVTQGRSVSEAADQRILDLQKVYTDALARLREILNKRGAQPA